MAQLQPHLTLLVLILVFRPTTVTSCSGLVIPGIERMARGVDITKLDLYQLQVDGFKATLIELTCNDPDRKWSVSGHVDKDGVDKVFLKTDQVAGVDTNFGGSLKAKTTISEDSEQLKDSMSAKVGLSVDSIYGGFSASAGVKMASESMYKKKQSVAETSSFTSSIEVDFYLSQELRPSLSKSFVNYFNTSAPIKKYIDNQAQYDKFVETFGTHYFGKASLGGYMYMKTTISESLMKQSSTSDITASLEMNFYGIVKASAEFEKTKEKIGEQFFKETSTDFTYLGGDAIAVDPNKPMDYMEKWTPTVFDKPHLFSGELRPMEELIENEALRVEVGKACQIRMLRAGLEEILGIIEMMKMKDRLVGNVELLKEKITSLELEANFAEMSKALKGFMFYVLQAAKVKPALKRMLNHFNTNIEDVLSCRNYLYSTCAPKRSARNVKLASETEEFFLRLREKLSNDSWSNYTEGRALLKEGTKLLEEVVKPVELCPVGDATCRQCRAISVEGAIRWRAKPFCIREDSWKVVQYKPAVPRCLAEQQEVNPRTAEKTDPGSLENVPPLSNQTIEHLVALFNQTVTEILKI